MMIACNNGVGMNIGFPDVCLTPMVPAPVPIPYPNLAANAMAVPFSPNIKVGFMPALNMAAKIPLTNGDNAGVAHPLFMQMGQYTMGNPLVFVNCMPAVNLLCPTTGNMMNNPLGAVLVPSVCVTMYTDAEAYRLVDRALTHSALRGLEAALDGSDEVVKAHRDGDIVVIRIERFASDVTTLVFNALQRAGAFSAPLERVIVDVRGNPGGDAEAALRLADDFVERGTLLALRDEGDDEPYEHRARQSEPYPWPLTIWVDEHTASAAELFAGALQANRRANVAGCRTAGKASGQGLVAGLGRHGARTRYQTVCHWRLPNGTSFEGVGLLPDSD